MSGEMLNGQKNAARTTGGGAPKQKTTPSPTFDALVCNGQPIPVHSKAELEQMPPWWNDPIQFGVAAGYDGSPMVVSDVPLEGHPDVWASFEEFVSEFAKDTNKVSRGMRLNRDPAGEGAAADRFVNEVLAPYLPKHATMHTEFPKGDKWTTMADFFRLRVARRGRSTAGS